MAGVLRVVLSGRASVATGSRVSHCYQIAVQTCIPILTASHSSEEDKNSNKKEKDYTFTYCWLFFLKERSCTDIGISGGRDESPQQIHVTHILHNDVDFCKRHKSQLSCWSPSRSGCASSRVPLLPPGLRLLPGSLALMIIRGRMSFVPFAPRCVCFIKRSQ